MSTPHAIKEKLYRTYFKETKAKDRLTAQLSRVRTINSFKEVLVSLEDNPEIVKLIFESSIYAPGITLPAPAPNVLFNSLNSVAQDSAFI